MKKVKLRIEALFVSLLMMLSLFSIMPQFSASAAYPSTTQYGYERWKQTDSKWKNILLHDSNPEATLGDYGCVATSFVKLLAHSGVCSDDESVFNPSTCLPVLKKANVFDSSGIASWTNVTKAYPNFKYYKGYTMSGTQAQMLKEVQANHKAGYYQIVKVECGSQHWVSVHSVTDTEVYIMDSGGYGYNKLSKYQISGAIRLYTAPNPSTWREKELVNISYADINAGTYYIKNNSTGTYLSVDSAKAADKQNVSVAAKSNSKAFQFKTTGGTEHYLYSMLDNNYVLNPYSDTPTAGTNVTLFKKVTDGTQIWGFESVNGGYIIRLKYNPNCVLAVSGSNVQLATYTGAANQIWTLEKADVVLSSIKINEDSFCSIYENGSTFNPNGLTLTATYSDGSTKTISEGYTLSEVNLDTVGETTLTATYGGKTASATITINDLFEGEGTDSSPYLVNTALDLENVAKMVNNPLANGCYGHASYKQTADIDLSEYSNWTPIGVYINSNSVFNGNYNGDYNKISNLNVNYDKLYTGLFGRINSASQNAVVKNLSVSGNVSGAKGCVGGIVGETGYGAAIENCDFTGTVNGLTLVGGITGKIQCGATITNCYANCEVTASEGNAGGIVGGILVGANNYSTDATIGNSYFVGKISGTGIGGICGLQTIQTTKDCKITYTNNYYLNSAAAGGVAGTAQAGCTGLISSQLKTIATDLGSPFVDNADDTLNNGYPVFEWQIETPDERIPGDANNDGTIDLKDVVMIRRYVAGGWDVELDASNADVNADNVVDLKDVVMLRRYIAGGWDVELK